MKKYIVAHQVLDPSGSGGVSAEFRSLKRNTRLTEKYIFEPIILVDYKRGLNWHDIKFYYKKLKMVKPDIIHIRGAAIDGLNAVIAAKMTRKGKILVTVHGMYSDLVYISSIKRWISKNIIERLIFGLADGISCVCKNASDRSYFDRYRSKMLPFIYNRMPHYDNSLKENYKKEIRNQYDIPMDAVVGLYLGRMTREKGLDVLIKATKKIQKSCPKNLVILFVGDGEYKDYTEKAFDNICIKTVFAGNQRNVEKYYYAGDFFIQPSLHENHSISLLEACAAHIPSIATDCGGNTEIIDDEIGMIVKTGSSDELADAILKMCVDSKRDEFLRKLEIREFVQFSDMNVDASLDLVYQEILGR